MTHVNFEEAWFTARPLVMFYANFSSPMLILTNVCLHYIATFDNLLSYFHSDCPNLDEIQLQKKRPNHSASMCTSDL